MAGLPLSGDVASVVAGFFSALGDAPWRIEASRFAPEWSGAWRPLTLVVDGAAGEVVSAWTNSGEIVAQRHSLLDRAGGVACASIDLFAKPDTTFVGAIRTWSRGTVVVSARGFAASGTFEVTQPRICLTADRLSFVAHTTVLDCHNLKQWRA